MHYLPFSLTEPLEEVKEIDVIMRVKINSIKMMKDQNYGLTEFEQLLINPDIDPAVRDKSFFDFYEQKTSEIVDASLEQRLKIFQLALQQLYRKTLPSGNVVTAFVFFAVSTKTGTKTSKALLVNFIKEMGDNNYNVGILITEKPLNVNTKGDIDKMTKDTLGLSKKNTFKVSNEEQEKMQELTRRGTLFYHFVYVELLYDILNHYLVPKHTIFDNNDRLALINSGINIEDLSFMSFKNPVARHIGAIPGDIIMVTGENLVQTGSRDYINYKLVKDLPT